MRETKRALRLFAACAFGVAALQYATGLPWVAWGPFAVAGVLLVLVSFLV
jgi:hypothetical protein